MQKIVFDAGEKRHVKFCIHAAEDRPFTIHEACWELRWEGETEAAGNCVIDNHILDAYISPQNRTTYTLKIEYKIADEILVEQVKVEVT